MSEGTFSAAHLFRLVCSIAKYRAAYEDTQLNRVSDFHDFVWSLFPKAILFWPLFYSTVAGVMPYGGRKKSPRAS